MSKNLGGYVSHLNKPVGYWYLQEGCGLGNLLLGAPKSYWGQNATEKEGNGPSNSNFFVSELSLFSKFSTRHQRVAMRHRVSLTITRINRSLIRHSLLPFPRHIYMRSYTEHAITLYSAFSSTFLRRQIVGPPKLPPELERRIFEECALDCPQFCTVLVRVSKRAYEW